MKVLMIKLSSMGDVIHALPALTDAMRRIPSIQFDWAIEPAFAEIPHWHVAVDRVIPVPLRGWRKQGWKNIPRGAIKEVIASLRDKQYDYVIDAQGLIKSAVFTALAKGTRVGWDYSSVREKIACLAYQQRYNVPSPQHAVERIRQLVSQGLGYSLTELSVDYGMDRSRWKPVREEEDYVVFCHGTTWDTKHWPELYWKILAQRTVQAGYKVLLPWGNVQERERAQRIQQSVTGVPHALLPVILPPLSLSDIAAVIAHAKGVVAVDTGLAHIAAMMGVRAVSLYGPTDPALTGAYGVHQRYLSTDHACAPCLSRQCRQPMVQETVRPPCFGALTPARVWEQLEQWMT